MTPTDTIERVAQSLRAECLAIFGSTWNNDNAARLARAAIEAMREPSGAMIDAGAASFYFDSVSGNPTVTGQPSRAYCAMIDAALGRGGV